MDSDDDPTQIEDERLDVITRLIDFIFLSSKCNAASTTQILSMRMAIGFRKMVALCYVIRPKVLSRNLSNIDDPAWKIAEAIGITPARFSQLCHEVSKDLGGLRSPTMNSKAGCLAKKRARMLQTHRKPSKPNERAASPCIEERSSNQHRKAERIGVNIALRAFLDGKPWTVTQAHLLQRCGLTDDSGTFTKPGIKAMNDMIEGMKGKTRRKTKP